jgi:hypothetical protein
MHTEVTEKTLTLRIQVTNLPIKHNRITYDSNVFGGRIKVHGGAHPAVGP